MIRAKFEEEFYESSIDLMTASEDARPDRFLADTVEKVYAALGTKFLKSRGCV
jgi:hypothetical protein